MMQNANIPDANFSGPSATTSKNAVVLEARGLQKSYGSGPQSLKILVDANLSLLRGEMVAIVAPSGEKCASVSIPVSEVIR